MPKKMVRVFVAATTFAVQLGFGLAATTGPFEELSTDLDNLVADSGENDLERSKNDLCRAWCRVSSCTGHVCNTAADCCEDYGDRCDPNLLPGYDEALPAGFAGRCRRPAASPLILLPGLMSTKLRGKTTRSTLLCCAARANVVGKQP